MISETIDFYEGATADMGVTPGTAKRALATAIETAIRKYYGTSDCLVDMDTRTANIVFHMPRHRRIIEKLRLTSEVLEHDLLPITLSLAELPAPVKKVTRSLFRDMLNDMKVEDDFSIWKKQSRRIIDGVILGKHTDYVEVDVKGAVGILKKEAWVPSEESLYRTGNVMFFYISAVKRLPEGIMIGLSRSSIKLPALIFKSYLPRHRFVCLRRFIGHKSIVHTDAPIRDKDIIQVRKRVCQELSGEILELRRFR